MHESPSIFECQSVGELLRRWLIVAAVPLAMASILMLLCYVAVGTTLGLYFGGVAVFTLIGPTLMLAETDRWNQALVADAIVSIIALAWLWPVFQSTVGFGEWIGTYLVLATYAAAWCGIAMALERIGVGAVGAAAMTLLLGLAWLSWPIWLAPWLAGAEGERIVAILVPAHPLFALNGWLSDAFPVLWAQHRLTYILTNIGDDIPYTLPTSILPTLLLHGLLGGALVWASRKKSR
ncbi:MAG TPA: hypothetical protein VHP11_01805 [Tepidisphaeraceae bacterium]|nr:hypothetical protein [Tepidisphaeraceae bacterium]